jgi:hypothetical protein
MNLLSALRLGVVHGDFHGALHDGYFVHLSSFLVQHMIIYEPAVDRSGVAIRTAFILGVV